MSTSRTRLAAVTGATFALILAGTAVASANGLWADDQGMMHRGGFGGGFAEDGGFGRGGGLMRDRMAGIEARYDTLVRVERTLNLDEGIVVERQEHGTVTSVADGSLSYTLATGEAVTVVADDETAVAAVGTTETDRPFRPYRMSLDEVALTDIAAGADVVVWSTGQDDGSFLAQQIVVLPAAETADDSQASDVTEETETAAPAA